LNNKRNPEIIYLLTLTRQSHERFTLLRVAAVLISALFSLSLTHGHKKHCTWHSGLFLSASCLNPVRITWMAC
jgi:hypothetical protein